MSDCVLVASSRSALLDLVNGNDSLVSIAVHAKGSSRSLVLNGMVRSHIGWQVRGRKDLANLHVESKLNPSEHATRDLRLCEPDLAPE